MVNYPLRALVEKTTARVNEDLLIISERFEALCRIFFSGMVEEARTNCLPNLVVLFHVVSTTRNYWKLEPVQDLKELLTYVLGSFKSSFLNEVVVAPLNIATVLHPRLIHSEHSQMIPILMIKTSSLLVSELLFLSRPVKHVLDR